MLLYISVDTAVELSADKSFCHMQLYVLVSTPPVNNRSLSSASAPVFSSSSVKKRDELMDVGREFVTDSSTSTKPPHSPPVDSTSAGQLPSDSTPTHQVITVPGFHCMMCMHSTVMM